MLDCTYLRFVWLFEMHSFCVVELPIQGHATQYVAVLQTYAPQGTPFSTLGDVDWSLFHIQIWFFMGHHDQYGQNWGNISQFAMWLSQRIVYIYKTDQSTSLFQHLAARFDSAMNIDGLSLISCIADSADIFRLFPLLCLWCSLLALFSEFWCSWLAVE